MRDCVTATEEVKEKSVKLLRCSGKHYILAHDNRGPNDHRKDSNFELALWAVGKPLGRREQYNLGGEDHDSKKGGYETYGPQVARYKFLVFLYLVQTGPKNVTPCKASRQILPMIPVENTRLIEVKRNLSFSANLQMQVGKER